MDSINQNQEERNHEDLTMGEAAKKIMELAKSANTCFFCTKPSTNESMGTRPMSIQKVDDSGTLYFLSANDSSKNMDIKANADVKLYFQGSKYSDFLYIEGSATISEDKTIIKELWEPIFKVWFTEGENDPRISVIMVKPSNGYYWDNKHGNAIAAIKMLTGAVIGKTMDDSIEGTLKV